MFTEQDSKKQDAALEALKEEFRRLDAQEKEMRDQLQKAGIDTTVSETPTPEVAKMLEEAKEKAKQEGSRRAAEFLTEKNTASASTVGKTRKGIIRA